MDINNFENVKPGTLALVENGIGGASAIVVYLKGLQEVHGFTISAEGVIGCAITVPHENIIKAFGITCVDGTRIRDLLTELFTGNGTVCQDLYKIYQRSTKIIDMTIEEVSEIVSRQRGKTVKVNIVEQCEESIEDEESIDDADDNRTAGRREWELSEHSCHSIEPAIGDVVTVYGVRCTVAEGSASCHKCEARANGCALMHCAASDRQDNKYVYLEKIEDGVVADRSDDGNSEWSISTQDKDVVEPKLGTTGYVYGVKAVVSEVSELHGDNPCDHCAARGNGCLRVVCIKADRSDKTGIYLRKAED